MTLPLTYLFTQRSPSRSYSPALSSFSLLWEWSRKPNRIRTCLLYLIQDLLLLRLFRIRFLNKAWLFRLRIRKRLWNRRKKVSSNSNSRALYSRGLLFLLLSEVKWLSPVGATGPDDIDSGVSVVRYKAFCLGLGQTYSTGTNRKARPVSDDTGE